MATIKRTASGPKIGPTGSTIGAPKGVGTTGADKTNISTAGGQYPFLPAPKRYEGSISQKSGQVASGRVNDYSFLPKGTGTSGKGSTTGKRSKAD